MDIRDKLDEALVHHRAGRLDVAEPMYREIVSVASDAWRAWYLLGVVCYRAGKPHSLSVRYLVNAARLNPGVFEVWECIGDILMVSGKPRWALIFLTRAGTIRPWHRGLAERIAGIQSECGNARAAASWKRVEQAHRG